MTKWTKKPNRKPTYPIKAKTRRMMGSKSQMIKSATFNRGNVVLGQGFPKKMVVTHKYREAFDLTSTTGLLGTYLFRCNGMFDPNFSGTGHQPMYYDQLTPLYDHFCVIGSKIKLTLTPSTVTTFPSRIVAFVNDDTSVTGTTVDTISEQSQAKQIKQIPAGNNSVIILTLNWSAKKYFGGSVLSNPELQGSAGADPTEQSTYVIAVQAYGANSLSYLVQAEIEYIAVWKELKDVAGS